MRFPIDVRYNDYDAAGHVNNAVYLTYFETARVRLWGEALGLGLDFPFVVAAASVRYASPALLGEPLDIEISAGEVRTRAWVWRYRVTARASGRLVADGETTQVMYDYAAAASVAIPPDVRERLESVAGPAVAAGDG